MRTLIVLSFIFVIAVLGALGSISCAVLNHDANMGILGFLLILVALAFAIFLGCTAYDLDRKDNQL